MSTWDASIKGNDTTLDIYDFFMEKYNYGDTPSEITKLIKNDFKLEFTDHENKHNALFGLALAQWETKSLEIEVLNDVKNIIESDDDLKLWAELNSDEKTIKRRKKILNSFLDKISISRSNAKRRRKKQFDFKMIELVKSVSPNRLKEIVINEEFVDGKYKHTSGIMKWYNGGSSGILYYNLSNRNISAKWIDESTLLIQHDKDVKFSKKELKFFFCGDSGKIIYEEQKE